MTYEPLRCWWQGDAANYIWAPQRSIADEEAWRLPPTLYARVAGREFTTRECALLAIGELRPAPKWFITVTQGVNYYGPGLWNGELETNAEIHESLIGGVIGPLTAVDRRGDKWHVPQAIITQISRTENSWTAPSEKPTYRAIATAMGKFWNTTRHGHPLFRGAA